MFKFDFTPEDLSNDERVPLDTLENEVQTKSEAAANRYVTGGDEPVYAVADSFCELSLDALLSALPPMISYSAITVPLRGSTAPLVLPRRDLFDARFQLMAVDPDEEPENKESEDGETKFLNAPSDLVPGAYEGGFKTWECSIDLMAYLHGMRQDISRVKNVLELGCGTALPTSYIFQELLSDNSEGPKSHPTVLRLQDYNSTVLELVTLPNLLLAWFFSDSSKAFREAQFPNLAPPTLSSGREAGELPITPSLLDAFRRSLDCRGVALKFYSGAWLNFDVSLSANCDLVLTSETIYRTSSVPALIRVLRSTTRKCLILLAAKVVYFGVGGGVREFVEAVQKAGGCTTLVWEMNDGVGRQVLRLSF
ncbi:hypothetical protein FRB94_004652 [Tulasnella sp. JGI-2019a]|nr:hypothetical protein FRB94_004652 [Tulasnella sp. JGI-2019a]